MVDNNATVIESNNSGGIKKSSIIVEQKPIKRTPSPMTKRSYESLCSRAKSRGVTTTQGSQVSSQFRNSCTSNSMEKFSVPMKSMRKANRLSSNLDTINSFLNSLPDQTLNRVELSLKRSHEYSQLQSEMSTYMRKHIRTLTSTAIETEGEVLRGGYSFQSQAATPIRNCASTDPTQSLDKISNTDYNILANGIYI